MISLLLNKSIVKIISFFLLSPGSKYQRKEIKEITHMDNVPLDVSLKKLLKTKILIKERRLLRISSFLNEEAKKLLEIIRKEYIGELKSIPLQVFYLVLEVVEKLSQINEINEAYLFGSYAKLIYSDKSDVDIAVFIKNRAKNKKASRKKGKKDIKISKVESEIKRKIKKIESKYKKTIEIHVFFEKDKKEKDPLIKEILRNNVRILG